MIEAAEQDAGETGIPGVPALKKKERPLEAVSQRQRNALNAILSNVQVFGKPMYEDVSFRFEMKIGSLRSLFYKYRKGMLDFSKVDAPDLKEINAREQLNVTLHQLGRLEQIIGQAITAKLKLVDEGLSDKDQDLDRYQKLGIMQNVQDLKTLTQLRLLREKSLLELIETINKQRTASRTEEKPVTGKEISPPVPLSEHAKLQKAFSQREKETPIIEAQ